MAKKDIELDRMLARGFDRSRRLREGFLKVACSQCDVMFTQGLAEHGMALCLNNIKPSLKEWGERWPYKVSLFSEGVWYTPDTTAMGEAYRAIAWRLADVRVSSVSGGSIWFQKRD